MGVAHRVEGQHRIIEALVKGVRGAIEAGDLPRATGRLVGLTRALDAHFVLEESHYFPVTRKAHPDLGADLERLVEQHREIRSSLERIADHLDARAWEEAGRAVAALDSSFRSHEDIEAKLLRC